MNRHDAHSETSHVLDPMRIAQHPLFTAREKIELLEELKDGVTRSVDGPGAAEFSPEEIEAAIDEVKHTVGERAHLAKGDA